MIQCSYEKLIYELNCGKIQFVRFCVNNYSHYKNCTITKLEQNLPNGQSVYLIEVALTQDFNEKISFLERFKEDTKLFDMGRKGKFTLKQLWPKITVLEIIYNQDNGLILP